MISESVTPSKPTSPLPSASALEAAEKRQALLKEVEVDGSLVQATEEDLDMLLREVEANGWTCKKAMARRFCGS